MGVGIVLPLERFVMLSMANDQTTQANGELTQPSPPIIPPPTSTSDKTAYGVEYAEEIKGHGAIERIVQKWPVVRMDFRVFFWARPLFTVYAVEPACLVLFGHWHSFWRVSIPYATTSTAKVVVKLRSCFKARTYIGRGLVNKPYPFFFYGARSFFGLACWPVLLLA